MYQIRVKIKKDGKTEVKAEGFQGPSCTLVTKPFIDALGIRVAEVPTEEMFQENQQQQETNQ